MPRISPPVSLFRAQICPVSRFLCAAAPAVNGTTISPPLMVSIFDYFLFSRRTVTFLWIFSTNSHLKRRVDLSNDSGVLNWKCCFCDGMGWAIKFLKWATISLVYGNPEKRSWHESVKLEYFSFNIKHFDNDMSLAAIVQFLTAVQVTSTSSNITNIIKARQRLT